MNCVILVLENPFFTYPDGEGRFRIENVPEGEYFLKVWHKTGEWGSRPVTIPTDNTVSVDLQKSQ